jgi:hypothetical protein
MTTFQDARSFLLKHRTDYDAAVKGFRWPDPVPFNWALDWFDAELARNPESKDRSALWIVDAASDRETRLSFEALSRRSNQVANFLKAQGLKRGDHLLLLLGNVVPLWETMLAAMKLGVVVIPATTLLTPDELRDRLDRGPRVAALHGVEARLARAPVDLHAEHRVHRGDPVRARTLDGRGHLADARDVRGELGEDRLPGLAPHALDHASGHLRVRGERQLAVLHVGAGEVHLERVDGGVIGESRGELAELLDALRADVREDRRVRQEHLGQDIAEVGVDAAVLEADRVQ